MLKFLIVNVIHLGVLLLVDLLRLRDPLGALAVFFAHLFDTVTPLYCSFHPL